MISPKALVVGGVVALLLCLLLLWPAPAANTPLPRVAHAGGAIDGQTYTNSIEALDANYALGFRTFEIDFSWTSDEQLVCLHDWRENFERSFGIPASGAKSLAEFEALVRTRSAVTKCTLDTLADWISSHPDTRLITDVKENNAAALRHISANYPQLLNQVAPQIYQPEEYETAAAQGFDHIIWTLYQYPGGNSEVLRQLADMSVWAVTMDAVRAEQGLGLRLDDLGLPTFVHTINDYADFLYFQSLGIDEIYTDILSPQRENTLLGGNTISMADSNYHRARLEREQLQQQRITAFRELPTVMFQLSGENWQTLNFQNQIAGATAQGGGVSFLSSGEDPYFILPVLPMEKTRVEVFMDITTDDASNLELFYSTRDESGFSGNRKIQQPVRWGRNRIVLSVSDASPITQIRIDPGTVAGRYVIEQLEVRAY